MDLKGKLHRNYKEMLTQLFLHFVLFIFYSYAQDHTFYSYSKDYKEILNASKILFFLNYVIASLITNYYLLPKFYYKKKFLIFFVCVSVLVAIVILVDEFVLEQIYFPDTRGSYFPGITFTLIETLPLIIIFIMFKLAWDFNKKQSEIEQLKHLVNESELQFLKSQINPHFLFNNLNNLYAYASENSSKTPSIILELSSVLRYMLYDCSEDYVSLNKEIKHLKNFTALNELQIEDRGEITFITNQPSSKFLIAPLILNVFIENAFKHSMQSQSDTIKIDINIHVTDEGMLTFKCINSYNNQSVSNNKSKGKGIGLMNVKKRLHLLYPDMHTLEIENNEHLYAVLLQMNLITQN